MTLVEIKERLDKEVLLWVIAFVGTCVLVGLNKLDPKMVEMFLFALVGRAASSRKTSPLPTVEEGPDK